MVKKYSLEEIKQIVADRGKHYFQMNTLIKQLNWKYYANNVINLTNAYKIKYIF